MVWPQASFSGVRWGRPIRAQVECVERLGGDADQPGADGVPAALDPPREAGPLERLQQPQRGRPVHTEPLGDLAQARGSVGDLLDDRDGALHGLGHGPTPVRRRWPS